MLSHASRPWRAHTSLMMLLGSYYFCLGSAQNACTTWSWSESAFSAHCPSDAARRSVACSMAAQCSAALQYPLAASVCTLDRLFITLCAEQPALAECTQFRAAFTSATDYTQCVASKAYPFFNTSKTEATTISMCDEMPMSGCNTCTASSCPDPLSAYNTVCKLMPEMSGCEEHNAFCAAETTDKAWALCGLGKPPGTVATADGADACVTDPTAASCQAYVYPDASANSDLDSLCGAMPDMPGCSIRTACKAGEVASKHCKPFTLLATACTDMPTMAGCASYKQLCKTGSVVKQCASTPAISGTPTWSSARSNVFDACDDHPMAGCSACTRTSCEDPLASYALICQEMPGMSVCSSFWSFCKQAPGMDKFCAADSATYLPSMLMYFHQRTQELVLWKTWRPMNAGEYAGTVIAILVFGIVSTGLKTIKGALTMAWAHDHDRAALAAGPIWKPNTLQLKENVIKSAITGVSLTLDYFNMLIAMTFNIGLFCAVICGYILGALLFSHVLENYNARLHQRRHQRSSDFLLHDISSAAPNKLDAAAATPRPNKEVAASTSDDGSEFPRAAHDEECTCMHGA